MIKYAQRYAVYSGLNDSEASYDIPYIGGSYVDYGTAKTRLLFTSLEQVESITL